MNDATDIQSSVIAPKRRSRLAEFFRRLVKEKPLGTVCGIIILILILVAIFADVLMPYRYTEQHLADRLQGPSAQYLLGTDQLGRDFMSRLIVGARLSLVVGLSATAVSVVVAVLIGGASGFFGGKLDLVVQRFVDAWIAFPGLLHTANHNVHNVGKGCVADNTGPGDIRRHRRVKSTPRRRYRH